MKKQTKLATIIAMGIAGILFSACSKESKESGPEVYDSLIDLTVVDLEFDENHRVVYSNDGKFALHICDDNNHHKQTTTKETSDTVQISPLTIDNMTDQMSFLFNGDILWLTKADGKPVDDPENVHVYVCWNALNNFNIKKNDTLMEINDKSYDCLYHGPYYREGYLEELTWSDANNNIFYIGSNDWVNLLFISIVTQYK